MSVVNSKNELTPIAGIAKTEGYKDGTSMTSRFNRPYGLCSEGRSMYVTDAAYGRIVIMSDMSGTLSFLHSLGNMYRAFGIHVKKEKPKEVDLQETACCVNDTVNFLNQHIENAKLIQGLTVQVTIGPQATISNKTTKSVKILYKGIEQLDKMIKDLSQSEYNVKSVTLLTNVVENLHAVSHMKHQTFSVLEYARDFSTIIRESIKRVSMWSVKYFTNCTSYYPVPDSNMKLSDLGHLKFGTEIVERLSKMDQNLMKLWCERYRPIRQRSVRDETTKDKAGTLPICLYQNQKNQYVSSAENLSPIEEVVETSLIEAEEVVETVEYQGTEYDTESDEERFEELQSEDTDI